MKFTHSVAKEVLEQGDGPMTPAGETHVAGGCQLGSRDLRPKCPFTYISGPWARMAEDGLSRDSETVIQLLVTSLYGVSFSWCSHRDPRREILRDILMRVDVPRWLGRSGIV